MNKLAIILTSMVLGAMLAPPISQAMSEAGDRKMQADKRVIEQHKLYIGGYLDNLDNEEDIDDDIVYQTSAQAKAARHANEFLAKIREVGYE